MDQDFKQVEAQDPGPDYETANYSKAVTRKVTYKAETRQSTAGGSSLHVKFECLDYPNPAAQNLMVYPANDPKIVARVMEFFQLAA